MLSLALCNGPYLFFRWLPIHLRDLVQLQQKCSEAYEELKKGHFVTYKTEHKFSAMAHDQICEQLNTIVKDDGVPLESQKMKKLLGVGWYLTLRQPEC